MLSVELEIKPAEVYLSLQKIHHSENVTNITVPMDVEIKTWWLRVQRRECLALPAGYPTKQAVACKIQANLGSQLTLHSTCSDYVNFS